MQQRQAEGNYVQCVCCDLSFLMDVYQQIELWGQCPPIEKMDATLSTLKACKYEPQF
jgi:hypothetical protein